MSETAYEVRRDGVLIATLPVDSAGYVDTTVLDGANYSYVVAAANATGSAATAAQTGDVGLAAPSSTTAVVTGNAPLTVSVGWVDNPVQRDGLHRATRHQRDLHD